MADCSSAPGLMPFEQAKSLLLKSVSKIRDIESINIEHADGRILSGVVCSSICVPSHNNSAMDGYALRDDSLTEQSETCLDRFKLIGASFAGQPFNRKLNNGECVRIMTGAMVPEGANSVVMQENVKSIENEVGAFIELSQPTTFNNNIRFAGEDIEKGQVLFGQGHRLKAVDIGLLASLGQAKVQVFRPLTVAVFSTGDELKLPGQPLNPGDIFESNSQVLVAMLKRLGMDVINLGIIPDNKESIKNAFLEANERADAVISSGGVSVGDADYTKEVLDELGKIDFWKVAMKPGKPFAFGHLSDSVFFGLPGNPVSATVTFHQLALPALLAMSNCEDLDKKRVAAITTERIKKRPGRMDFQRGIISFDGNGQTKVTPLSAQGSGILSSVSRANGYIILSQQNAGHEVGDIVEVELFDHIIGN